MKLLNSFNMLNSLRVTPAEIKKETQKKFKLVITGSPEMVSPFYETLIRSVNLGMTGASDRLTIDDLLQVHPLPMEDSVRQDLQSDAIIFLLSHKDADRDNLLRYRDLYKLKPPAHLFIEDPGDAEEQERLYQLMDDLNLSGREWIEPPTYDTIRDKAEVLLKINPRIDAAMAYRFPILRDAMAQILIHKTGIQNMIIALASSLPANIPIIGIIVGLLGAAGETTVLTMNQLKLCMQLAGIYGLELNLADRIKELWPLVGTAFGFRAIARTLVGFIPVAGPTIKGAIAYAGTHLVGETSRWYYEEGRRLSADEKNRIYKNALAKAKQTAALYFDQLKAKVKKATRGDKVDPELFDQELEELREDLDIIDSEISHNDEGKEILERSKKRARELEEEMKIEDSSINTATRIIQETTKNENKTPGSKLKDKPEKKNEKEDKTR